MTTTRIFVIGSAIVLISAVAIARLHRSGAVAARAEGAPQQSASGLRWFKGNLHTHSLWSDGDDFPERIAMWYREHGYQFLAISDHNTLEEGDRWTRFSDLKKKGAGPATIRYLKDFPDLARTRGDVAGGSYEVRLTPFEEYRPRLEIPGKFLLIQGEELSDKLGAKAVHMGALNLDATPVKPQGGASIVEVIRNDMRAIDEEGRRERRPYLQHLNHPNFKWSITAEEMAQVVEEQFFEVYNGHPSVFHQGDKDHPSIEHMWDVANTLRLTSLHAPPLMGLGSDDSHNYHVPGAKRATPGRGWNMVRAAELSADALIAAMRAGDFYASSGVTLKDVRYDSAAGALTVEVEPEAEAKFSIQFVGTLPSGDAAAPTEIGAVLAASNDLAATYKLTGRELYVRAVITSDRPAENPSFEGQLKQAWTQPVGWETRARK